MQADFVQWLKLERLFSDVGKQVLLISFPLWKNTFNCVWQTTKLHTREHNVSELVSYRACRIRLILFSLQIPLWSAYTWLIPLMRSENHPTCLYDWNYNPCIMLMSNRLFSCGRTQNYFSRCFQTQDSHLIYELFAKLIRKTKMHLSKNVCPHTCTLSLSLCVCVCVCVWVHPTCWSQGGISGQWAETALFVFPGCLCLG